MKNASKGAGLFQNDDLTGHWVVAINKETHCRPQNTGILIIGTSKKGSLILRNPTHFLARMAPMKHRESAAGTTASFAKMTRQALLNEPARYSQPKTLP